MNGIIALIILTFFLAGYLEYGRKGAKQRPLVATLIWVGSFFILFYLILG